jgi:hypothetical protein
MIGLASGNTIIVTDNPKKLSETARALLTLAATRDDT